jgi:transglutaminase-like putative cysteine protease
MNVRLTLTCGVAVILASFSVYPLIQGWGWFFGGTGAAIVVTAAALLTRLPKLQATITGGVLAAVASLPLLWFPGWYIKVIPLVVVAATVASSLLRRYVVIYLAGLLIYLNAAFATGHSLFGFLPTRASLHQLGSLASAGLTERAYVPPVPGNHGVVLLAAGGVGLMAVATDLLAVRLRSPAIAGLPLLALYSVPITTNAREGGLGATIVFCLAVIGYLGILAADGRDRLRIWGRLVTVWQYRSDAETEPQGPDTKALAAAGRRIGLAAVCFAIVLPLVLPGISVHGLFTGHNKPGPGGKTTVTLPKPLVQMQQQLLARNPQTVATYTSNSSDAGDHYLQMYVLNSGSDAGVWKVVPPGNSTVIGGKQLRRAPGTVKTLPETSVKTQIKLTAGVFGGSVGFLPVPYAPSALNVSGQWAEDNSTLQVFTTKPTHDALSYTAYSKIANPTSAELDRAQGGAAAPAAQDYIDTPAAPYANLLGKLASRIVGGAATQFDQAIALQRWFTTDSRFTYSVSTKLPDTTAGVVKFLTKSRQGYCQQFAIGMAVLARFLGIPSRIAVGYTAGDQTGPHSWRVTTADAHAWPELYFGGIGWLRFEPTPSGPGEQGTAIQPDYARSVTGPIGPNPTPTAPTSPGSGAAGKGGGGSALSKLNRLAQNSDGGAGGPGGKLAHHSGFPIWLIIVIILAVALVTPGTARVLTRRYRWGHAHDDVAAAHAAWRELRDDLADHGMACRPSETPRSVSHRLSGLLALDETARQALARIAEAEERACYATVAQPSADLRSDVATVRRAMAQEAIPLRRWQARLFPSSMLTPARAGVIYALDVFGWMEAAGQRLRARTTAHGVHPADSHHNQRQVLG